MKTHTVRGGGGLRLHVGEWGKADGPPSVDLPGGRRTLEHGPRPSGSDLLLHQGRHAGEQGAQVWLGQIERGVAAVGVAHGRILPAQDVGR